MGVSRTKTVKNKHATRGSGVKNSKAAKNPINDPVVKARKTKEGKKAPIKPGQLAKELQKKKKRKVYAEKDLDIPELNTVTPIGVQKPKGQKKGKVFVDDRESMNTILAMVQAEKEGQIESKMMKARHMEAIREARKIEAEKKQEERRAKLDETKDSLRKKRKRPTNAADEITEKSMKRVEMEGTKATKPKKKRVAFAE
ncbi:60S ribosomal subunit assembly/export protein LOC1 [Cytospora mali]|uniref:60S ribosomal subunit assembly/export protein LOC1 n=2 Tax=Cytospora mali TaxID=578113 RepID=A0A194ULZ5_CYTMA|nr:60S ribosomal subunit assembly/export protein LOC1 [Valsa mali var. pyri (nom. inval.)]KUI71148.1 60S ribosomal subunit assembly/export protein LOC1 [Valsa mali]